MRIADREFKPVRIGLRSNDDVFLHLVVLEHPAALSQEGEMEIKRRGRAKLQRLQDLDAALRASLKNKATPARHLSLADAGPAAAEVRAREIDKVYGSAKAAG